MKKTGKKRFDFAIMNPPYANHIGERILADVLKVSEHVATIQPATWLFGKRQNKNITKYADECGMEINTISATEGMRIFENATFNSDLGIAHFGRKSGIVHNGKRYAKCSEISFVSNDTLLSEYKNSIDTILKKSNDNLAYHLRREPFAHSFTGSIEENNPNPEWYCLRMKYFAGHAGKDDFYTCVARDKQEIERRIGAYKDLSQETTIMKAKGKQFVKEKKCLEYYYAFDDIQHAYNLVNYMQTDFVRGTMLYNKFNLCLDAGPLLGIPWFDFTDPVFSKTPREIDNYLFAKYEIRDEIRKHLEELLPDYYGIRNT